MISVPVRMTAAARSEGISFNMLHAKDHVRLKQKMVCSVENVEVDRKDTVKGYQVDEGQYIIITDADLDKIKPQSSKTMEVLEFVNLDDVDPVYFDTSYYLVPEQAGEKAYFLLTRALEASNYVGMARLTMHQRENVVCIRPSGGGLMLHTLYYHNEVRDSEVKGDEVKTTDKELEMAKLLVDAMATEFNPEKYSDTYQNHLKELIQARMEGRQVEEVPAAPEPSPAVDLIAALKASIAAAKPREERKAEEPAAHSHSHRRSSARRKSPTKA
jgi:DNA end-binding protein Ku